MVVGSALPGYEQIVEIVIGNHMLIPKSSRHSYRSELMEDIGENTKIAFLYFGKIGAYDILRIMIIGADTGIGVFLSDRNITLGQII